MAKAFVPAESRLTSADFMLSGRVMDGLMQSAKSSVGFGTSMTLMMPSSTPDTAANAATSKEGTPSFLNSVMVLGSRARTAIKRFTRERPMPLTRCIFSPLSSPHPNIRSKASSSGSKLPSRL